MWRFADTRNVGGPPKGTTGRNQFWSSQHHCMKLVRSGSKWRSACGKSKKDDAPLDRKTPCGLADKLHSTSNKRCYMLLCLRARRDSALQTQLIAFLKCPAEAYLPGPQSLEYAQSCLPLHLR